MSGGAECAWFVNGLALALSQLCAGCGALVVRDQTVASGRTRVARAAGGWAATLRQVCGAVTTKGRVCTIARAEFDCSLAVIGALTPAVIVAEPGDHSVFGTGHRNTIVLVSVAASDPALLRLAATELAREYVGATIVLVRLSDYSPDSDASVCRSAQIVEIVFPGSPVGRFVARSGRPPRGQLGQAFDRLAAACCAE